MTSPTTTRNGELLNRLETTRQAASIWWRPPGVLFHATVVLPAVARLWAVSVPGTAFFLETTASTVLRLAAAVWMLRLVTYLVSRRRGRQVASPRWFLVAPVGAAVVLVLLLTDAPLRARWTLSVDEFTDAVSEVSAEPAPSDWQRVRPHPRRIGWYDVDDVYRLRDAVVFYEGTGAFLDDAGFAYLPSGPFPELHLMLEALELRHLEGPWYAWTASW